MEFGLTRSQIQTPQWRCYTFDGNKNVSELVHFESRNGITAHYDYAPFGAVTRATNTSVITDRNFHLDNPFRFSSEYHDDILALVYYNYRYYNPTDGRWCGRVPLEELRILNLYQMKECVNLWDLLGQDPLSPGAINSVMTQTLRESQRTKEVICSDILILFKRWFNENEDLTWTENLPLCPSKLKRVNGKFVPPETGSWKLGKANSLHPGGWYELRVVTTTGIGNQCVYDKCGNIMTSIPAAGSADRSSPKEWWNLERLINHYRFDVTPYKWAIQLDECYPKTVPTFIEQYYMRRPILVEIKNEE